jgi:hypothetical protein
MLSDLCAERKKGLDDNWTTVLGRLTSNLNIYHGRQTNSVSVYNAGFGTEYRLKATCLVEDARLCQTIEELKKVLEDDDHLDRYLNGMKGDHNDEETNDNTLGDTDTALIKKGLSYWDNNSYSDSESDNDDPVSSYDNLFGFYDDEPDHPSDALFDENGIDFGSPVCGMAEVGMVGTDDVDSKLQSAPIQVEHEDSKLQSAQIVSEQVCGLTETDSRTADDGDVKFEAATIDFQPIGGLTECNGISSRR